jgi:hypothetical protein
MVPANEVPYMGQFEPTNQQTNNPNHDVLNFFGPTTNCSISMSHHHEGDSTTFRAAVNLAKVSGYNCNGIFVL